MKKTQTARGARSIQQRDDMRFFGIALVGLVLYFWNLTGGDMLSDNALNSFRALGWLDYLGGVQTTPIQWFGATPWWGNLSFHDAPPLVFALQHFFFSVFGPTVFAAKIPFALAGFALIFALYFTFKQFKSEGSALLASLLIAVSSFGIWASRAGYLEGIEVLFIALGFLFFLKYQKSGAQKHLLWWGVFAGLALLSKYTALFILPAAGAYLLLWRRDLFRKRAFWLALLCLLAVLSPLIIYNEQVYQARGHFDAALSAMVGMHSEDFGQLAERGITLRLGGNLKDIFKVLSDTASAPLFAVMVISLLYLCIKVARKKGDPLERFLLLNIFFLLAMFSVGGAALRFLSLIVPFFTASAAIFLFDTAQFLKQKHVVAGFAMWGIIGVVIAWEAVYAANTHFSNKALTASTWFSSASLRLENKGFNQLDAYLNEKVFPELPPLKRPATFDAVGSIDVSDVSNGTMVFFDEAVHWFAYSWYLQKYIYYKLPVVSLDNYIRALPEGTDPLADLKRMNAKDAYYILSVNEGVLDGVKKRNPDARKLGQAFAAYLEANRFTADEIRDSQGNIAFLAYHIKVNQEL